jgi:DNA-binding NtrC family response regulator
MIESSILFVDDKKLILRVMEQILVDEEFNKFFASSADEALEILESKDVNVIVTDIIMPNINGLQLLQMVKKKYPKVVRVALSGCSNASYIVDVINKGEVYRYLTKPLQITEDSKRILQEAIEYSHYLRSI